jgi:mannose-6-phosphate isomerase-like protein (cupin superfamily)
MGKVSGKPHEREPVQQAAGVRRPEGPGRWQQLTPMPYKEEGAAPFRAVTRQVLFADDRLGCEWRYFEVAEGGFSTLERHEHVHAVMIHRGRGQCLVGTTVTDVAEGSLVFIPPLTWHQFRANAGAPLGFLCLVNGERDRPQLPTATDLAGLRSTPAVAAFIRTGQEPA